MSHGVLHNPRHGVIRGVKHFTHPLSSVAMPIIAILGQSNAVGQGDAALVSNYTGLNATYAPVTIKQKMAQGPAVADPIVWTTGPSVQTLRPYTTSTANIAGATTTAMGIEIEMGKYLHETLTNGLGIVQFAVSGTSIAAHWHPSAGYPASGDNLFTQAMDFCQAAQTDLTGQIACIVWIQGESDAQSAPNAAAYEANLTATFNAMRVRFPGVPIVAMKLSPYCTATETATVRAAQVAVQAALPNIRLFNCDDLELVDGYHFASNSIAVMGTRAATEVLKALSTADNHTWTKDATDTSKSFPRNAREMESFLSSINLSGYQPMSGWDLTQPSGALVDLFKLRGDNPPTTNTIGTATFQQAVAGLSTVGITTTDGATTRFSTTSGLLPAINTTASAALAFGRVAGTPAAIRSPMLLGTTVYNLRFDTGGKFRCDSGANNAVGTATPAGANRPYFIFDDLVSTYGATDQEILNPTRGALTGKQYGLTFGTTANIAGTWFGVNYIWHSVKWSPTTAETLLAGLGWTIPW